MTKSKHEQSKRKKVVWKWDWGVYMCFCPYCDEPAYETDHCVFCGKEFDWVEGKHKPTIVECGKYTVVQATNNHIHIYRDGRMVSHSQCEEKQTEEQLREHARQFEELRGTLFGDTGEEDST